MGLQESWTLTCEETSEVHPFDRNPLVLPSFSYEQTMTEHKLLSGAIKYDKSTVKVKVLHVVWGEHNFMDRIEREKLEGWLDLNCKFTLKWFDEDDHEHKDYGYLIADSSTPVYMVGYTFGFSLRIVSEG